LFFSISPCYFCYVSNIVIVELRRASRQKLNKFFKKPSSLSLSPALRDRHLRSPSKVRVSSRSPSFAFHASITAAMAIMRATISRTLPPACEIPFRRTARRSVVVVVVVVVGSAYNIVHSAGSISVREKPISLTGTRGKPRSGRRPDPIDHSARILCRDRRSRGGRRTGAICVVKASQARRRTARRVYAVDRVRSCLREAREIIPACP